MSVEVAAIIALVSLLASVYFGSRKAPHEARQMDGEGAMKFEQAAASIAARNIELMKRIEALERSVAELEQALMTEKQKTTKFEDWARRLVGQLQMLGAVAVPFEQYPQQPDTVKKP